MICYHYDWFWCAQSYLIKLRILLFIRITAQSLHKSLYVIAVCLRVCRIFYTAHALEIFLLSSAVIDTS